MDRRREKVLLEKLCSTTRKALCLLEIELKPEFKKEWLNALRGNDYQQTRQVLRDSRGYCCLGVACDLVDSDRWMIDSEDWDSDYLYEQPPLLPEECLPPQDVAKDIFTSETYDEEKVKTAFDFLSQLNDAGADFDDIAFAIEYSL